MDTLKTIGGWISNAWEWFTRLVSEYPKTTTVIFVVLLVCAIVFV